MASFWKPDACGQTVLPDRSVFIRQELVENDKIQKFKCDILSNFQTMCVLHEDSNDTLQWIALHDFKANKVSFQAKYLHAIQ